MTFHDAIGRTGAVPSKLGIMLLSVVLGMLGTGCRTVLPPDQPSRLWNVFLRQNSGYVGAPPQPIPHPTQMVGPQAIPGDRVFVPPLP